MEGTPIEDLGKKLVEETLKEEAKKVGLPRLTGLFVSAAMIIYILFSVGSKIISAVSKDPTRIALNKIQGYVRTSNNVPIYRCMVEVGGIQADNRLGSRTTHSDSNGYFCFNTLDAFKMDTELTIKFVLHQKVIRETIIVDRSPHIFIEQIFPEELIK